MRAYKVSFTSLFAADFADEQCSPTVRYVGTQADARATRDTFVNDFSVKKSAVEIEEVEIPMAKGELLAWINALL